MSDYDYGKAEADLEDVGCHDPEEIYERRSKKGFEELMKENGLNPDKYRKSSGGSNSSNNGGCYLTTACIEAKGLPDDCRELMTLRSFRDNYLKNREGGVQDIEHYYMVAPKIVEKANKLPNSKEFWLELYNSLVAPCVKMIEEGQFEEAYALYKEKTLELEKNE